MGTEPATPGVASLLLGAAHAAGSLSNKTRAFPTAMPPPQHMDEAQGIGYPPTFGAPFVSRAIT